MGSGNLGGTTDSYSGGSGYGSGTTGGAGYGNKSSDGSSKGGE